MGLHTKEEMIDSPQRVINGGVAVAVEVDDKPDPNEFLDSLANPPSEEEKPPQEPEKKEPTGPDPFEEIARFDVKPSMMAPYVKRALGTVNDLPECTREEAAKILEVLKKMKGKK